MFDFLPNCKLLSKQLKDLKQFNHTKAVKQAHRFTYNYVFDLAIGHEPMSSEKDELGGGPSIRENTNKVEGEGVVGDEVTGAVEYVNSFCTSLLVR